METQRSTFRMVLSSGKSVVKLEEPGSSPCDYIDKVHGSGSSDVSGISCSSGGCNAGSNDFGSGSGADVPEEKLEILEESSKDVSTDLGDFIPLPSPEQSDCEVECVGDKKSSSVKLYLPLKLLSSEDLGQVNVDVQFAAPSWDGYSGHPSIDLVSGVSPPLRTSDCHSKEGSQNSRKVKGLYSDAQGDKTSVFSRLKLSPSTVFQKAIGDLQQSKGKRRNTNSFVPRAFEVTRDNDEKVKSQIGSDQHKKTTKEAEFTLRDGKDASEYKQLAREYTGAKEEKTRGHDSVQDIMDLLLQRHGTWRKFNARTNSFRKENVDPTGSNIARDTIVMIRSKKVNDNGNKTVRKARIYVPEKEGHEKENKTKEQLPATLQQNGHWKRTRQSEVPNPNHEDEKDSEKSTNMGIMLKKQDQTIGDSESKCKFEQGHQKKVARPLFDKSSEVKTFPWKNSGSVQMSSEESSAEKKENSGSCEAPTTGKTADGKTDSSHDEVQPVIYPLQCNGNKGEAACNSVEKKSKLELLIDQFNAGKAETACNLVEEESELELLVGQFNAYKGEAACNMVENESKLELRVGQFNADKGEAACNLVEESKLELLLGKFNADGGIVTTQLKTYVRRRKKAYVYSTSPV
ncbi:LOW QUALITY PROTEIN: hypothetical protein TorRG33x02_291520 [Trema orientale]|uniref:Uncharacterized protein n=1 Tax=Trema orientale TaxID=63057 RepID=A0A2P5CB44_TREOI|nr:LOW QUALITY PROTEIN: hypothetical protein TorRG33x02_291520 [Trema orientale]